MNTIKTKVMNKILKGLSVVSSLLLFANCSDMLDYYPESEMSDATYWKTANDFKAASGAFYGDISHPWLHADLDADILGFSFDSFTGGRMLGDIQVPQSGDWGTVYGKIRTVNFFLEKAAQYSKPEEIKQFVAEAHFFRAWHYYGLYQDYGGVPLVKRVLDVNSPELYAPRDTKEDTFKFILEEVEKSIADLPLKREIAASDEGRISRQAAWALKARICLFEATWRKYHSEGEYEALLDSAIVASDKVISTGDYEIFYRPEELGDESYKFLFSLENKQCNPGNLTKQDNKEYIFYRKYDDKNGRPGSRGTDKWQNPVRKFVDMFVCKNGLPITYGGQTNPQFMGYKESKTSELENRDLRLSTMLRRDGVVCYYDPGKGLYGNPNPPTTLYYNAITTGKASGYVSDKFNTLRYINDNTEYCIDYPLIRYAEVLLIYAEAKIERYGSISDEDLNKSINELRKRAGVAPLTNELLAGTGLNMRDEIRRERACELYYEGFRLFDLKRWHIVKEAMTEDILGLYLASDSPWYEQLNKDGKLPLNEDGFHILTAKEKRKWEDHFDYEPIAYDQLKLNANLKQNEGYPDGR